MKIAIPVNEKYMESSICMSFGRAPYYLIYNTDTQKSYFLDNRAADEQCGAGIKAAQIIVDSDAAALLIMQCGEKAAIILNAADIKMYKILNDSIIENITAFNESKLPLLKDFDSSSHGHRGE